MKRGTFIALGLTAGVGLFLFTQRQAPADEGTPPPKNGGAADRKTSPGGGGGTDTVGPGVTPPPRTEDPYVARAHALITKAQQARDQIVPVITLDEAHEMGGLAVILRGVGGYDFEVNTLVNLGRDWDNATHVARANVLLAKAELDLTSVTKREAQEMGGLAVIFRGIGRNDYVERLETLGRAWDHFQGVAG